jgi:hypothetical protein
MDPESMPFGGARMPRGIRRISFSTVTQGRGAAKNLVPGDSQDFEVQIQTKIVLAAFAFYIVGLQDT